MTKFDLQRFADEEAVTVENPEPEKPPIPEELQDISEEIARDVMAQHSPEPEKTDVEKNDFDNVKIAYSEHKKVLDEKSETEKLLEEYKKRFGDLNQSSPPPKQNFQPQQNYQQDFQPQQNFQQPPVSQEKNQVQETAKHFGAEEAKQIDNAVDQLAFQLTGFSPETVEELDYADDDDPRISIWKHARRLAENITYNEIISAQIAARQEEERRNVVFNQAASNFNTYINQQREQQYFSELQKFAGTDYFNSLNPIEQQILREVNDRLEKMQATPQDLYIQKKFFEEAITAFNARNQQIQQPAPKPKPKAEKPQFPRTDKVNGTPGEGGGNISNAALAEMLKNTSWDKIPQHYKDVLLNSTT